MTKAKRTTKTDTLTPQQRQRNIRVGVLAGCGMAVLTVAVLLGLMALAYYALLIGLLIITPTNIMFVLVTLIAALQIVVGALVGYRTTGEKRTLAKNLRRAFFWFTLLLIVTSPAYICPLYLWLGDAPY